MSFIHFSQKFTSKLLLVILLFSLTISNVIQAKTFDEKTLKVFSPDKNIEVAVELKEKIRYTIKFKNKDILVSCPASMTLGGNKVLGANPKLKSSKIQSVNNSITSPNWKRSKINDQYNELVVNLKDDYSIVFRVYNEGAAYRFVTAIKGEITVESEEATFNFTDDHHIYIPYFRDKYAIGVKYVDPFESLYDYVKISEIRNQPAFLPVLIDIENGPKVAITESDLDDYAGLNIGKSKGIKNSLTAEFANYPSKVSETGYFYISERANYIAKTKGTRNFPWRMFVIAEKDEQLADNDMVYKLATPTPLTDISWIKAGKAAWDWWHDWNISGVPFRAGMNTDTYKYYIDFASANNLEYIVVDEGWAANQQNAENQEKDLLIVNKNLDLPYLINYAKGKNVGIILWASWFDMYKQLKQVFPHYAKMGIKGFKVDFLDRDDQIVVNYIKTMAIEAAKNKLVLDFHGHFKPTGLHRTYPNVLNYEGVHGLEQSKMGTDNGPEYTVTIPFIRMLAGPMDYTPGAMTNANKENFRAIGSKPMSQGTRCHQLAMFVVYEAPLEMLCDAPTEYQKEPEIMKFLSKVPNVWDETKVLKGKVSDYIVTARRKGNDWYIGGMTDWTARELQIDLSFLGEGKYTADIYADGINADRNAEDYTKTSQEVNKNTALTLKFAPGGGWAARIYSVK